MAPDRRPSTRTERLPPSQSSAISPWRRPAGAAAPLVEQLCSDTPRCRASAANSPGTPFWVNQAKMSPTPLCPASYPHNPATMPPSTTPHMPGTSASSAPFMLCCPFMT